MTLGSSVGEQVRRRRGQRGLSAAELARRAGISKAALSGLESGRGNPTLDTLDALALALGIPLADLITASASDETVLVPGRPAGDAPISQQLLRRIPGAHALEVWHLRMTSGASFPGVPHTPGTLEHLLVVGGSLTAGHDDDLRDLAPGDLLAFSGDAAHSYTAGPEGADVHVLIATPA